MTDSDLVADRLSWTDDDIVMIVGTRMIPRYRAEKLIDFVHPAHDQRIIDAMQRPFAINSCYIRDRDNLKTYLEQTREARLIAAMNATI